MGYTSFFLPFLSDSRLLASTTMPITNIVRGPGTIIQIPIIYDTGSSILSIFYEDFLAMGFLEVSRYPNAGPVQISLADGSSSNFEKFRRLSEPGTNIGWSAWVIEEAIFRPALPGASRWYDSTDVLHWYRAELRQRFRLLCTTRGGMSSPLD